MAALCTAVMLRWWPRLVDHEIGNCRLVVSGGVCALRVTVRIEDTSRTAGERETKISLEEIFVAPPDQHSLARGIVTRMGGDAGGSVDSGQKPGR
jgi:hypothetical protein